MGWRAHHKILIAFYRVVQTLSGPTNQIARRVTYRNFIDLCFFLVSILLPLITSIGPDFHCQYMALNVNSTSLVASSDPRHHFPFRSPPQLKFFVWSPFRFRVPTGHQQSSSLSKILSR
uniref:Uncharacterized protein n=1 Tax=Spongospora subterranea TaxID=70186 RepID=A0A0H5QT99_9EUKA|eukprot:CRZ05160.1 hypothetical protein [Spongospora subterranea]